MNRNWPYGLDMNNIPNNPWVIAKAKGPYQGSALDAITEFAYNLQKKEQRPVIFGISKDKFPIAGSNTSGNIVTIQGSGFMRGMTKAALVIGTAATITAVKPGIAGNNLRIVITGGGTSAVTVGTALGITTITFDANLAGHTFNTMAAAINADVTANKLVRMIGSVTAITAVMSATALTGGIGYGVDVVANGNLSLMVDNAGADSCIGWTDSVIVLNDTPNISALPSEFEVEVYVNGTLSAQTYVAKSDSIKCGYLETGVISCAYLNLSGVAADTETVVIGGDTYTFRAVMPSPPDPFDVEIGTLPADTRDNLLAAIIAAGTEDIKATSLGAGILIRNADGPDGNVVPGTQTLALSETMGEAANIWDKANLNIIGERPRRLVAEGTIAITADLVARAVPVFVALPFTADVLEWHAVDVTGAFKVTTATGVLSTPASLLEFDHQAGGTKLIDTDAIHWRAYAY